MKCDFCGVEMSLEDNGLGMYLYRCSWCGNSAQSVEVSE